MKKGYKHVLRELLWLLLIPFGAVLSNVAAREPGTVENIYTERLYHSFSQFYSRIFGIASFSVAEVLLYLILTCFLAGMAGSVFILLKHGKKALLTVVKGITRTLTFVSIAYILFLAVWGFNYYRQPFAGLAGYDSRPVSAAELEQVCRLLIKAANEQRNSVPEDRLGVARLKHTPEEMLSEVEDCYEKAAKDYIQLSGKYAAPKPVLLSKAMSYLGISGIYSPFTAEANVNMDIPDSMLPSTACHEAAHLRGFAREDEANFISYIACSYSDSADFQYSGTLLALIYSMKALRTAEPAAFMQLRAEYSAGVVRDMAAINKYWDSFSGPAERAQNKVNNAYLKANKQAQGVASYGKMVDLLIMKYRKDGLGGH